MNTPEKPSRFYTPIQSTTASLLGGPLPGCWLAAQNAKQLQQLPQRRMWLLIGILGTLLLPALVSVLPDRFPPRVLPIAYTVTLREMAKKIQGEAIATHRAADGALGSWWTVVGLGVAGAVLLLGLFAFAVLLFPSAFPE